MFEWRAMKSTTARTSGSDVGYGPRAHLLELLAPARGKVAVEVQALLVLVQADLDAVEVAHPPLGNDAPVAPAIFGGAARDHEARVGGMLLPPAVGIGDAHRQDASVAIDILEVEAVDGILVEGIRARGGADELRLVGERPFGAVGIDARADVDRARVEQSRHLRVVAVSALERVQVAEARGGRRELGRVDVAVHPERGLVRGRSGRGVGDGDDMDVASLMAPADRFDGEEGRLALREPLEDRGQVAMPVESDRSEAPSRAVS
jgi:hypothetical protein